MSLSFSLAHQFHPLGSFGRRVGLRERSGIFGRRVGWQGRRGTRRSTIPAGNDAFLRNLGASHDLTSMAWTNTQGL